MDPIPSIRTLENPIVERLPDGSYLCVYDSNVPDAVGYACSADGTHWNSGHALHVQPRRGSWARDVRTPLGLVHERGNEYTLFYTGFESEPDWEALLDGKGLDTSCAFGLVRVAVRKVAPFPLAVGRGIIMADNNSRYGLMLQ